MKFSINLDFVYDGVNYLEAIKEIKQIGFDSIEICFMQDKSIEALANIQKEIGINVELMLSDFVNLTDALKKDAFINKIKTKLEEAKTLGCNKIIIAVGDDIEGVSHIQQLSNIEIGIEEMIPIFKENNAIMLLEPINNTVDHMGCGLWSSKEAFDMARRFNCPEVMVLYDIYHMQVMEGDVIRTMLNNLDLIDHVHCAGNPGRNELYIGELNYVGIVRALNHAGFKGCVGIEYSPTVSQKEGLTKIKEMFSKFM